MVVNGTPPFYFATLFSHFLYRHASEKVCQAGASRAGSPETNWKAHSQIDAVASYAQRITDVQQVILYHRQSQIRRNHHNLRIAARQGPEPLWITRLWGLCCLLSELEGIWFCEEARLGAERVHLPRQGLGNHEESGPTVRKTVSHPVSAIGQRDPLVQGT